MNTLKPVTKNHLRSGNPESAERMPAARPSPYELLLPYQRDWVMDGSRFKIWLKSRQVGGSFAGAFEIVAHALEKRCDWVILSAGERQARDFMRKIEAVSEIFADAIARGGERVTLDSSACECLLGNGSRIIALPSKAETVRGYSANLFLDEFAFHQDAESIWQAVFPMISNPLRGKLKLRIVSTASGRHSKFHELLGKTGVFSVHRTTIHDAVRAGLPVNLAALKAAIGDADAWAQEYECVFMEANEQLFSYEALTAIESPDASEVAGERLGEQGSPLFLGIDVGRREDRTVAWTLEEVGDVLWTREVLVLEKTPFPVQEAALLPRIRASSYAAIDATGIGGPLAEQLARSHEHKLEAFTFTSGSKRELFDRLRRSVADHALRIPECESIREDLASLRRVVSPEGCIKIYAPRNRDGHADRASALALAVHAGARFGAAPGVRSARQIRFGRDGGSPGNFPGRRPLGH